MTLGTQTQAYGKLLDYEQFIDHQLARTRSRIKLTDVITAGLTLVVAFLATLFLEVVMDHAVGLPIWLRQIVLAVGLGAASVFTALRLVLPLLSRINSLYAAKTIESTDSTFRNSLINYLELRRHRTQLPKAVMAAIEARAVSDLTQVEVETVVNQQRLMRMAYALSGVIVIFCVYAAVAPKNILDSARRAFLADISRPTNTRLVNLKLNNESDLTEVVAGSPVAFSVDVQGVHPQKVLLHYSVDDGKFFALKEFAQGRNYYDAWQITLNNVQQSMEFYLTGGDCETPRRRLKVLPAPTVNSVKIDLEFPSYTKVPPRMGVEGGTVEAIVGTIVTVHATTNMPAQLATINLSMASEAPAPMDISPSDSKELSGKFNVKESGSYTIQFRTTGGQANPSPVNYDIIAIPDRPPTARFLQPDKAELKVPANVKVDLVMTGTDDHGVRDATLHVKLGNEVLLSKNVLEGRPAQPEFKATETLDLEQLHVKAGSTLTYKMTVRDNKEPSPNPAVETETRTIEVIEPVAPEQKQQIEEQQRQSAEQKQTDGTNSEPQPPPEETTQKTQQEETAKQSPDGGAPPPPEEQPRDTAKSQESGKGAKDGGASPTENPPPSNPNAGNAPQQMSPEQQQRVAEAMKEIEKQRQASEGNQANGQPKNTNPPTGKEGDQSRAAPPPTARNRAGDNAMPRPGTRPQLQPSATPNPSSGTAPEKGSGQNDPANQVERANRDRNQEPGAGTNNQANTTPAGQRNPGEPTEAAQPGERSGNEAGAKSEQTNQGSRPGQDNAATKNQRSADGSMRKGDQDRSRGNDQKGEKAAGENGDRNSQQGDRNTQGGPESGAQGKNPDGTNKAQDGRREEERDGKPSSSSDRPKNGPDSKTPQGADGRQDNAGRRADGTESRSDRNGDQSSNGDRSRASGDNPRSQDMNKDAAGRNETGESKPGGENRDDDRRQSDATKGGQSQNNRKGTNGADGRSSSGESQDAADAKAGDAANPKGRDGQAGRDDKAKGKSSDGSQGKPGEGQPGDGQPGDGQPGDKKGDAGPESNGQNGERGTAGNESGQCSSQNAESSSNTQSPKEASNPAESPNAEKTPRIARIERAGLGCGPKSGPRRSRTEEARLRQAAR